MPRAGRTVKASPAGTNTRPSRRCRPTPTPAAKGCVVEAVPTGKCRCRQPAAIELLQQLQLARGRSSDPRQRIGFENLSRAFRRCHSKSLRHFCCLLIEALRVTLTCYMLRCDPDGFLSCANCAESRFTPLGFPMPKDYHRAINMSLYCAEINNCSRKYSPFRYAVCPLTVTALVIVLINLD